MKLSWFSVSVSHSVVCDSLWPRGLKPTRLLCPQDSPGKNTGVGSHSLLQEIFPTQGSNPGLRHCKQILYFLSHQGSPFWFRVGSKFHAWPPYRKRGGHKDTQEETLWEWNQRSECCRYKPRNAQGHQKMEEAWKDSSWELSEGAWPSWHLDSWSPELWGNTFLSFLSHQVCGNLLQQC